jgi:hypothetical protein
MIAIRILISLFAIIILNCSLPTSARNGTGTDAGEARIYGAVRLPGDKAGENVSVTLRKQDYLPFSISSQDQTQTVSGRDGGFTLTTAARGYYLVELLSSDSLCAIKRFRVSDGDTVVQLGDCMLDTSVVFTGKVLTDEVPVTGGDLLVLGLDKTSSITDDGSFSVRLPSSDQLFRIIADNGQSTVDVLVGRSDAIDTIHAYTAPATVLEDFENMDGFNSLTSLLGGGSWFAYTDTVNGGKSVILPTEEPGLVAAIDTTPDAYTGGSLHCTFSIDQSFSAPFALIGMDISSSKDANSSKSWFDLTNMTAFSFMAKGSGNIVVQFTCRPVRESSEFLVFEISVTLSSEWSKHAIRPSDIPGERGGSGITWEDGRIAVSNINFLAATSAELWLDELTVEGMNVTEFLK